MNIIEAAQGSQQWLQIRAQHFTASEAPAMLGLSKYKTRQDLLREKATGLTEEVDANKQRLFDAGHAAEAAARPLAEAYLQEDLFPATGAAEIDGLPLLASFDGLNMEETLVWENKLASVAVEAMIASGDLDGTYWPQVEQQLMVSGASRALFTACDGEKITDKLWYESKPERRQHIIAGWKQFAEDLANYQHIEAAPVATAAPQLQLPAVSIQVNGSIALIDNLAVFGDALTAYVGKINQKPETDQDFADLDATVKTLKTAEDALTAAENGALAQTSSIDQMRRQVAQYKEIARVARLQAEKTVKAEKENRRMAIVLKASKALADHMAGLNSRLGKPYMPAAHGDFAGAVKGLKTMTSIQNAVDTELARCKIEANEIADRLQMNLSSLRELAADHAFLFSDTPVIIQKANDDLVVLIKSRIQEHEAAEAKRLEAEREKIRAEEEAKATAKAKAEQDEAERQRKASEEAAAKIERDRLTDANQTRYEESAAQPTVSTVTQAIPPASAVVAAPIHLTTGTARIRDLIDYALIDCNADELSRIFNAIQAIKEERKAAA